MNYQDYEIPQDLIFNTRDIIDMGGLNCSLALPPSALGDAQIKRVEIKLKFSLLSKEILAQGKITGTLSLQCSRCLENFDAPFSEEFTQLYPTKAEIIDIMYITKQTLALLGNIQNICSTGCKGLCSFCGCNKNEKQCDCKPPAINQFACLKDKFNK